MNNLVVLLFVSFVALVRSEVISNEQCEGRDGENILSEVHEIRVDPCAGAEDNEPCQWRKGSDARIEIDFTPTRIFKRVKAGLYWEVADLPYRSMDPNACRYMDCPTVAGERSFYNITLAIASKGLIAGSYTVKFKLYEEKKIIVCQLLKIKLVEADAEEED